MGHGICELLSDMILYIFCSGLYLQTISDISGYKMDKHNLHRWTLCSYFYLKRYPHTGTEHKIRMIMTRPLRKPANPNDPSNDINISPWYSTNSVSLWEHRHSGLIKRKGPGERPLTTDTRTASLVVPNQHCSIFCCRTWRTLSKPWTFCGASGPKAGRGQWRKIPRIL